jgi:hypothetical protein
MFLPGSSRIVVPIPFSPAVMFRSPARTDIGLEKSAVTPTK